MFGFISNIQKFSVHDGPGIRTTVFMHGCPLQCWWCHNPETLSSCISAKPKMRISSEELMKEIKKDVLFMEESEGGVSFSGGEPLIQSAFIAEVLDMCKEEGIHTCIDTSGMAKDEAIDNIVDKADLFLYDIKFVDMDKHIKYTGVSNLKILNNLDKILEKNKKLIIRYPLIPGINDQHKDFDNLIDLLHKKSINSLDIFPYHRIAEGKYEKLNMENKMKGVEPHSAKEINSAKDYFSIAGFKVNIGGLSN